MKKKHGVLLDFDTADRIMVASLKQYRKLLKKELKDFESGKYRHPDDVVENKKAIDAIDLIIRHFDGAPE